MMANAPPIMPRTAPMKKLPMLTKLTAEKTMIHCPTLRALVVVQQVLQRQQ
jgi:hypothetical protein